MKAGSTINDPKTDLAGKKIGVQSGTTGEDWTKSNIPNATRVPFKTATEAFAALQAGNVDAVINDLPVTVEIVKDKARGLAVVKEIATGEQYGFAVSKDNPDLLKGINDALAKVKASGEYKTLYDKYFTVQ
jgi:polar amino acid transport system substrate-binding protein